MKIVLDTNVLVSGIFWGGTPLKILELWEKKQIEVLASGAILDEYLDNIDRLSKKYSRPDPDDNKFIDCAISGRAPFLVSGDDDLLVLKKVMNLEILKPRQFLNKFSEK